MTITEEKCEVQSFGNDLSGGRFAQYDAEMLGVIEARFIAQAVLHLHFICEQPIQKNTFKKNLNHFPADQDLWIFCQQYNLDHKVVLVERNFQSIAIWLV